MSEAPTIDLYAVLGVSHSATTAELRRAYRRLALAHHPDRAGPASAATFARIAEAYRLLSNLTARAAYDAHLFRQRAFRSNGPGVASSNGGDWTVSGATWSASWAKQVPNLLARLTGPIDRLVASGAARATPDGTLELHLRSDEARTGGTAIVDWPLEILCPTCGGVASPRGVWCRRCEYGGRVTEPVALRIAIPFGARNGMPLAALCERAGAKPPPVRIRVDR